MNKAYALLFALMMITVSLAGCIGGDERDSNDDDDNDGIGDNVDLDYDNDGVIDEFDSFPLNSSEQYDFDSDGIGDDSDDDDDNDGVKDFFDIFPFNESEQYDFDGDGIGDKSDDDDDNDGIIDSLDKYDYADVGVMITLHNFKLLTEMDSFDSNSEIFICVYIDNSGIGCVPNLQDASSWSMEVNQTQVIDYVFSIDLDDTVSNFRIKFEVWDRDISSYDQVNIGFGDNGGIDENSYYFDYFITNNLENNDRSNITVYGLDSQGKRTGGELTWSTDLYDFREQKSTLFEWDFDSKKFSMNHVLDYATYEKFKNLERNVSGGIYNINAYAKFSTPNETYVVELANKLQKMAIDNGYTSEIEIAEFIYSFVGNIPYQYDIDGTSAVDYPKYPIEMLWHQAGDCEDAAALYISLVEAVGFDAMLMVGIVNTTSNGESSGHAWAIIHIPNYDGFGWNGTGDKSDKMFYFVETTAYWDGGSYIGLNPWQGIYSESIYDIE